MSTTDTRALAARCARILHAMGFVHAFGHVSVRTGDGTVWITPTFTSLATVQAADLVDARDPAAPRRPLETPMHLALYDARPDVGAICRVHSPALSILAAARRTPALLHGFGGIADPVALWPDPDLIADPDTARAVAAALGTDSVGLLLAGNGGLAVGADLPEAMARIWSLEDRCRIDLALAGIPAAPIDRDAELPRRRRWYAAETARLWAWIDATHPEPKEEP